VNGQASERAVWSAMDIRDRIAWLGRFRTLLAADRARLSALMHEELSIGERDALWVEVAPLLAACRWLEGNARGILRDRMLDGSPFWLRAGAVREQRAPLGKIAIIASWMHPVSGLGIPMVQALVCGNTVVVKPSERSPKTQARLMDLAVEAGLPAGTLAWTGCAREAGANMLATQRFDHVVFTGSPEVGQRIAANLSKSGTPGTFALGGRDSAFVLADADAKRAARAVWAAVCAENGQTCTAPRRVLVLENVHDAFCRELGRLAALAKPVDLIDQAAVARCKEVMAKALAAGARDASSLGGSVIPDPTKDEAGVGTDAPTTLFRPAAIVGCAATMDIVEGRHAGPLVCVVRCANIEEAIGVHKRCDQHAYASVFTRDEEAGVLLAARLGLSNVLVNDAVASAGHPMLARSGKSVSGAGVLRGEEGLLAMTRAVQVCNGRHASAKLLLKDGWRTRAACAVIGWWYGAGKADRIRQGARPKAGVAKRAGPQGGPLPLAAPERESKQAA